MESFLNEAQSTSRNQANAASLQGQLQDENKGPGPSQSSQWNGQSKEARFKDRKCVCGKIHLFRLCPYIVKSARPPAWKEDKTVRNEIRQKIQSNIRFFMAIKKVTDTYILDGITE